MVQSQAGGQRKIIQALGTGGEDGRERKKKQKQEQNKTKIQKKYSQF